jgi:arginyl-tRNA synthetase
LTKIKSRITDSAETAEIFASEAGNEIWSLLVLANRLEEVLAYAANANEPAILAKYAFNLAKTFNLFYHNHKILIEKNPAKRAVLLAIADSARQSLTAALQAMGIEVPERM